MSDSEKIYLQLSIDVEQYGREVQSFSIDPDKLQSFQELKSMI